MNHLNGDQALAFSRNRTSFKDGDNQRGKNQMLVLTAILNKLQSPALLKNPSGVLDVVGRSMQTSLSPSQITGLISWQLDQGTGWVISRQAVIGTSDHQETFSIPGIKLFVLWPDESSVNEAADNIREMMNTGY
jgi:anionic cell wall polymer biosynthesis LytR-Cps2A-Psr (LCP) family protein